MASPHKASALNIISVVVLVLYSAGSPANTCAATSVPPNLMTGLNLGKLSSKIAVTGTLVNPSKFELRFKTLGSLLYLFDLQERVTNQIELMTSASAGSNETQLDDRYLSLLTAHALLENIIQNSCNYINQTLSDFFINIPNFNCDGFTPSPRLFTCSREAAKQLQVLLKFWRLNRDAQDGLKELCSQHGDCSSTPRRDWVNQLNLDTSDSAELGVKKYLNCII